MTIPQKLQICHCTLLEACQNAGAFLKHDENLLLPEKLVEVGVTLFQLVSFFPNEMPETKKRFPSTPLYALIPTNLVLDPPLGRQRVDKYLDHGADIVEMLFVFSDSQMCLYDSIAEARINHEEAVELIDSTV